MAEASGCAPHRAGEPPVAPGIKGDGTALRWQRADDREVECAGHLREKVERHGTSARDVEGSA